jgi:hypothetical protein
LRSYCLAWVVEASVADTFVAEASVVQAYLAVGSFSLGLAAFQGAQRCTEVAVRRCTEGKPL